MKATRLLPVSNKCWVAICAGALHLLLPKKLVGQANTVEEDEWHINILQGSKMSIICSFLGQTGNDTFYPHID